MNQSKRIEMFRRLAAEWPDAKSELNFKNPFELLVAVMLSAQATDKSVNIATEKLFRAAATPEAIVALGVEGLEPFIRTIGLFRNKAKHIVAACDILIRDFHSEVPEDFDALVSLPGVGEKTAGVVLNVAFGHPTIPVDTHVFRVSNRTGIAPGKTPQEVSKKLQKCTPQEYMRDVHHWLLLHGRYCCKARNPSCGTCPIQTLCEFPEKSPVK